MTCGITFTFGGLKIDTSGRVIDTDGQVIAGLHAAGELVGGLFYFNYPGGTGLMAGSVFGKNCRHHGGPARGANTGVTREISVVDYFRTLAARSRSR